MFNRLISFLKSGNKSVQLKYFYFERKAGAARLFNHYFRHLGTGSTDETQKVNLSGQNSRLYGMHRSGWNFAMHSLRDLHNPRGVLLDAFIDRTFSAGHLGFNGYTEPWIGFIHVPAGVPDWFASKQSNEAIFNSQKWKLSAPFCKGLFTLSACHKQQLEAKFNFPVENLMHPVEFPELKWSFERFKANPERKIVQTGWWLRKIYSIYLLQVRGYRKILLLKKDANMEQHLKLEMEHMNLKHLIDQKVLDSVTQVNFLSNKRYDKLLSENIVFLDLIDASATNAIIECIARDTPVLVNPLPAVIEYLGEDYPFYYRSLEEAARKAEDIDLVQAAHNYLLNSQIKHKLTSSYFRESFINSSIYKSL